MTLRNGMERVFPEGHGLHRLVRPTFESIRASMGNHLVSAIWMDSSYFPERAGYRVSYDEIYGPGSTNVMPFTATWLSSGPNASDGNIILFPEAIDRTLIEFAVDIGLLGSHRFIRSVADIRSLVNETHRLLYSIDDLGAELEHDVVVGHELSMMLNSKDALAKVSAYAPRELIKDMYEVTQQDFHAMKRDDARVFLKTCNTEAAGAGVFVCTNESDFTGHLADIRQRQKQFNLSRTLVLQPELTGKNRSFQVFIDPAHTNTIQVIAITDQLVEDDGKTSKGSINYEVNAHTLERIGPVILDMVDRVWEQFPQAFGVVMCDFFESEDGTIVVYDPGIRPTGNTATAMAYHYAKKLTGHSLHVSNMHLRTQKNGFTWRDFARASGELTDPQAIARNHLGLLPWGWNDVVGFGVVIGVAPNEDEFKSLQQRVLSHDY